MNTHAALCVTLAVALAAGPKAIAQGQIPLPVGQFSVMLQGPIASCWNFFPGGVPEPCSTSGVVVVPLSVLDLGTLTRDGAGNACSAHIGVLSTLPVGAVPSTVIADYTSITVTKYDPVTGTGDESWISYMGGACNGAIFNKTGATQITSGTFHFVVTNDGNRIDSLFTSVTGTPGFLLVGGFSGTTTEFRQTSQQGQQGQQGQQR
jgi:hypothetical protein